MKESITYICTCRWLYLIKTFRKLEDNDDDGDDNSIEMKIETGVGIEKEEDI